MLNELELGPNIARNTALSENVFMMVVCIELRIPLFVVGKPGSSKSLAKTVVAHNMQGDAAKSELFKTFKQVTRFFQIHCNVIVSFHQGNSHKGRLNPGGSLLRSWLRQLILTSSLCTKK